MAADPKLTTEQVIQDILDRTTDIAALPQVVFKITEMASSIDTSAGTLERTITVDPGFSTKLLAKVNSAAYSLPKQVTSIKEAVAYIGLRGVRELALTIGVFDMFLGKTDEESLRRRSWWRHSIDTAVVSRMIANTYNADGEEAYTAGLLHAIGKTALDRYDPASYAKVMQLSEMNVPAWQAEQVVFGTDHLQLNQALALKWGLPDAIVNALDYVSPVESDLDGGKTRAAVAIGEKISSLLVKGTSVSDIEAHHLPDWAMEILKISADQTENLFRKGQEEIAKAASLGS